MGDIINFMRYFLFFQIVISYKLNVPRILLPIFNDFSTKFTLEATEGGCFKWSTTRSDLITLTELDADSDYCCSSKVVVTSSNKNNGRNMAIVLAEEVHTKQILRCDVIVDVIDNLAIITTTRELFMGEAPEAFEVRAYDNQGNEFTTLEGVEFNWNIECTGPNSDTILEFITFFESPYETPTTLVEMESQNKQGHIVLLQGIKTGTAQLSVTLPYQEYETVKLHQLQLAVIANIIIFPSEVYLLVGDSVEFKIIHMNNGKMDYIPLTDSQFYLEVESKIVSSINRETGELIALQEGNTRVVLHDRNMDESDPNLKLPAALVNVVVPDYMVLSILPHRNWAILLSEYHDIIAEVFTSNDNKIHLGKGIQIHMQVGEIFHVEERAQNGSWLTGWATQAGFANVQARLQMQNVNLEKDITAQAQLTIYTPITLKPSEVVLAWDPQRRPKYEKQIIGIGGDGRFLWTSSNHTVGVVTQTGYVRTHTLGYFEVSAAMIKNHHNRETAIFRILPPVRLEIVEFVMEAEVGTVIYIHVAMYVNKVSKGDDLPAQIPITHCQDLPFKIKLSNSNFMHNKSSCIAPVGVSCANIAIIGSEVGLSTVTVSYFIEGLTLEDTVTVSTFKPLKMLQPKICEIVLAVGTSLNVLFEGGPQPIPGKQSLHKRTITSLDSSIVEVTEDVESEKPGEILLKVLCLQIGESEVRLSVSNSPFIPNSKNQESSAKVKVICGTPHSLGLRPEVKIGDSTSCPMDLSSSRVVVQSYKDIELDVIVTDNNGRKFLNISSLKFDWSVTPAELGEIKNLDGVFSNEILEAGLITSNKSFQVISPKSQCGSIEVSATIVSYHMNKLIAQGIDPSVNELAALSSGIYLFLVDDTVVTPNTTSIFNHPGNRKTLSVQQGSGYFEMGLSENDIAKVKYLEKTREIEIIPLRDGHLRITLLDLCLTSKPSIVQANIVSVSVIRVEMSDKVEIGRCISCIVKLYDDSDNILSIPDLSMISIESDVEHDIIKLKRIKEEPNSLPCGEVHYIITGVELGNTKISFSIGETSSTPIDLQVFSPLKVTPRNITLIIGSIFQLSSKGGPHPDSNVEYSADDNSIVEVSVNGLVKAKALGNTAIFARAVGINPTTGLKVIYSQDSTELSVIPLAGIKICAPLTRFLIDKTVPVWVNGIPEKLTPMILGTVEPPLKFDWSINDVRVINIYGPFHDYGIDYLPEDSISMRVTGRVTGKTVLNVKVTVPGIVAGDPSKSQVTFSAGVDIEVFESLALLHPSNVNGSVILMAPHCSIQLKTNLDGKSKLRFSLPGPEVIADGNNRKSLNAIVTLSESGLLSSYGIYGKTMVLITSLDDYGLRQTLSIIVEIKPVHYMLLNVIAKWQTDSSFIDPLNVIPTGVEFQLVTTYHDDTGVQFTTGTVELGARTSRFDLVKIRSGSDNSSVTVSMKQEGSTMVKVWADSYHKTADYIKIHSGPAFSLFEDTLTTGDVICLCSSMMDHDNHSGSWSSSDENLLSINPQTGVGHVEGNRGGTVSISNSLHPAASHQIQVIPANQVTMKPITNKPLINSAKAPVYLLPVIFSIDGKVIRTNNKVCQCGCDKELELEKMALPHQCHLEFTGSGCAIDTKKIFEILPGFDTNLGTYTCNIVSGIPTTAEISTLRSNVSVWAELLGSGIQAPPIELKFVPAIFVKPEVHLDKSNQAQLEIHGLEHVLKEVTAEPFDEKFLKVDRLEGSKNNLKFHVTLLDYHWKLEEATDIIVKSKITQEIINVHVKASELAQTDMARCDLQSKSIGGDYQYTLITMATMIGLLAITYLVYVVYFQPVVNVNVRPDQSLLSGPQTSPNPNDCAYVRYMQRTQGVSNSPRLRYSGNVSREPVYGDPTSFYSSRSDSRSSPRRFM